MKYILIPSIIATSQKELETRLKKIPSRTLVQLDVMDGLFVPHTSLEFEFSLPSRIHEAHLMVQNPEAWLVHNHAKISSIIVHYESRVHMHNMIKLAKKYKKKIGIALNPESNTEDIRQYLKHIDKVLIMTVHPGKYGSAFIPSTLHKINFLRSIAPKIDIEVDGGVTPATLRACKEAGANQFVVGSFLQKSASPLKAWKELQKEI